jgi:hypothetical protein
MTSPRLRHVQTGLAMLGTVQRLGSLASQGRCGYETGVATEVEPALALPF